MSLGPELCDGRFFNWARTASARPTSVALPSGDDEVGALLAKATREGARVKPVGGGHSWSDAACTAGVLLSLDRMRRLISLDASTGDVTVEAGMRLHELNAALALRGRALPVLGSISAQSIAGATATGTHGSAPKLGNLASNVTSMRLVLADGSQRDVDASRDPDLFRAARVGLGAFGIVTRMTLKTVPAFDLEETLTPLSFDAALAQLPTLVRHEPFVKVWWLPHTRHAVVFRYRPTTAPRTFSERARSFDEQVLNRRLLAGVLAAGARAPSLIPSINRAVASVYFRPRVTIGQSDRVLNLAMPPLHDELEYALPVERAAEALSFVRDLIERERLRVDFIVELRFSAADDAWLSPSHERATCWLGAYIGQPHDRDRYFGAVERQALAWGGRPHWGKWFSAPSSELSRRFSRWNDAVALRAEVDPSGTFDSPFLSRVFGTIPR